MLQNFKGYSVVLLLKLVSLLNLRGAQSLGRYLGKLMMLLPSETKAITKTNVDLCFPDLDSRQKKQLVQQSMEQAGMLLLEMALAWFWPADKVLAEIVKTDGDHHLKSAIAKGRGVVVIVPHIGNWEVLNFFVTKTFPGVALYRPAKLAQLNREIIRGREKGGLKILPTNQQGVRAMLKALKQGGTVYILPDQEPKREGGVFAPFFDQPALTMSLISKLVQKTGAETVVAYAKRLTNHEGFEVVIRPAVAGINQPDTQASVTALNQTVEKCIEDCPEQYQWAYKRFKRRPQNLAKVY